MRPKLETESLLGEGSRVCGWREGKEGQGGGCC